jgi:anti-sigma factor RsiW
MPAECDQVKILLGPFDDGELEPHEMEDVALHVVSCGACKAALDDYRSLGVALRDCVPQPAVEGFTTAVLRRIEQVPRPLAVRWRRYLDLLAEHVGAGLPVIAAGALAALVTVWLVTPYAHRWLHGLANPAQLASVGQNDLVRQSEQTPGTIANESSDESQTSMIALSNDPTTTVIWLPNQP